LIVSVPVLALFSTPENVVAPSVSAPVPLFVAEVIVFAAPWATSEPVPAIVIAPQTTAAAAVIAWPVAIAAVSSAPSGCPASFQVVWPSALKSPDALEV
jgi:hypothetical protein